MLVYRPRPKTGRGAARIRRVTKRPTQSKLSWEFAESVAFRSAKARPFAERKATMD